MRWVRDRSEFKENSVEPHRRDKRVIGGDEAEAPGCDLMNTLLRKVCARVEGG